MVTQLPRIARAKFSSSEWRWEYDPERECWKTYRIPMDWPHGLYSWLFETFGNNIGMDSDSPWDYHGGWIYFYKEECVTLFNLRWA
jgi:hypothetical protein